MIHSTLSYWPCYRWQQRAYQVLCVCNSALCVTNKAFHLYRNSIVVQVYCFMPPCWCVVLTVSTESFTSRKVCLYNFLSSVSCTWVEGGENNLDKMQIDTTPQLQIMTTEMGQNLFYTSLIFYKANAYIRTTVLKSFCSD